MLSLVSLYVDQFTLFAIDIPCFSGPVPILNITPNQTTIRGGEMIEFQCLFGGNYLPDTEPLYSIFWTIKSHGKVMHVDDYNDGTDYVVIKPSQDCHNNNYSCCQFVSDLHINTSETSVPDKTDLTCNAVYLEYLSVSIPSSLSEFIKHSM